MTCMAVSILKVTHKGTAHDVACSLSFPWQLVCNYARLLIVLFILQCFDTVGWAAGRASGL